MTPRTLASSFRQGSVCRSERAWGLKRLLLLLLLLRDLCSTSRATLVTSRLEPSTMSPVAAGCVIRCGTSACCVFRGGAALTQQAPPMMCPIPMQYFFNYSNASAVEWALNVSEHGPLGTGSPFVSGTFLDDSQVRRRARGFTLAAAHPWRFFQGFSWEHPHAPNNTGIGPVGVAVLQNATQAFTQATIERLQTSGAYLWQALQTVRAHRTCRVHRAPLPLLLLSAWDRRSRLLRPSTEHRGFNLYGVDVGSMRTVDAECPSHTSMAVQLDVADRSACDVPYCARAVCVDWATLAMLLG